MGIQNKPGPACEVFVVDVVSRTDGHDDVRRFLTILKKMNEINEWLMIDERRHIWMCQSNRIITVAIIYYRIYAIGINNRQQVNKQIYSISIDTIQIFKHYIVIA